MGKVAVYRATVNLPGLRAGETCEVDPDSTEYLPGWIRGKYLVKEKATPAAGRRSRDE